MKIKHTEYALAMSRMQEVIQEALPSLPKDYDPEIVFLEPSTACHILGITRNTLRKYRCTGKIGFIQKQDDIYYTFEGIREYLERRWSISRR